MQSSAVAPFDLPVCGAVSLIAVWVGYLLNPSAVSFTWGANVLGMTLVWVGLTLGLMNMLSRSRVRRIMRKREER